MIRVFRVYVSANTMVLLLSDLVLVVTIFLGAGYLVLEMDPTDYLLYDNGLASVALVTGCILMGLYFRDLYPQTYVKSRIELLQQLCVVLGMAFLVEGLISYLDPDFRVPIRMMILGSGITLCVLFVWRLLFAAYAGRVVVRDRLLLVGNSPVLASLGRYVEEHPESGVAVSGYVDDAADGGAASAGKRLGGLESIAEIVQATQPSRVVIGLEGRASRALAADLLDLQFGGHSIERAASTYEKVCGRVSIEALSPAEVVAAQGFGAARGNIAARAVGRTVVASVAILVTLPVMVVAALVEWLSSKGSILDRQWRVGRGGRRFVRYRFRSTGEGWAARAVRRFHFDGLPQLFNVLRGDMEFVGPRGERPEFVEILSRRIPCYNERHRIAPGVTGWARMKYFDPEADTLVRLEYDLYYVKNASLSLDILIFFHSLKLIFLGPEDQ